ncbi:MAG: TerB family tellurite resistance protein [Labilithrix sp.]|nr:TerB family tellurite resistance protein [Labilithrix sp.]
MDAPNLIAKVIDDAPLDDAVLDAIALSACADGVTNVEIVALLKMARQLPTLRDLPHDEIDARVQASFARLNDDGLEGRMRKLAEAANDAAARRRLFGAAVVMQYADGNVSDAENEFLLDFADALGLREAEARAIVDEVEREIASSS